MTSDGAGRSLVLVIAYVRSVQMMRPLPPDHPVHGFLDEISTVGEDHEMHLETIGGKLFAVHHGGGGDPTPIRWDPDLKRYRVVEEE